MSGSKKTFGEEILSRRRARERATEALEKGAPLVLQAIAAPPASWPPGQGHAPAAGVERALAAAPTFHGAPGAVPSVGLVGPVLHAGAPDGDLGPYGPRSRRRTMVLVFVVAALLAALAAGTVAVALRQ